MKNCCSGEKIKNRGLKKGLLYGLIPHTFCIIFFILTISGAAGGAAIAKKFLLIPNFFLFLTIASLLFASLAAFFYLRRKCCCNTSGIKKQWKYLSSLYLTTIVINILMAYVILPASANQIDKQTINEKTTAVINLSVQLPCPGHAPLITDEIKKIDGVGAVNFQLPRHFQVNYNPQKTNPTEIMSLEIFKTFKLKSN